MVWLAVTELSVEEVAVIEKVYEPELTETGKAAISIVVGLTDASRMRGA